ncbi:MAG TPA: MauE/DoxX family redox-associated membrane protein [Candidatus Acidoferrum sp.]|nr:MauE/DoxX family redox-associated membrane protein [Candidatus Acidoferrum sp.]
MTGEKRFGLGRILLLLGRLVLAGIFIFAAYAKMKPQTEVPWSVASVRTSLAMFAMQVDSYQLLPTGYVSLAAHLLPPAELLLGFWLLSGIGLRFSALATTLLVGLFFAVIVRTYAMGLEINCGCFGPGEQLGKITLVRDGSFLGLALAVTIGAFLVHRAGRNKMEARVSVTDAQRAD